MNCHVYPRNPETTAELVPIDDEAGVAVRIITAREQGLTKAQAVGPALKGSDDVQSFLRLWTEVEEERLSFRAVSPADFTTQTAYLQALGKIQRYLDAGLFFNGLKAERGVGTWAQLKASFSAEAEAGPEAM